MQNALQNRMTPRASTDYMHLFVSSPSL